MNGRCVPKLGYYCGVGWKDWSQQGGFYDPLLPKNQNNWTLRFGDFQKDGYYYVQWMINPRC
jgi:hypothetical protein